MEKWRKIKREQRSEKVKDWEGWKAERKSLPMVLSNLKIERETQKGKMETVPAFVNQKWLKVVEKERKREGGGGQKTSRH